MENKIFGGGDHFYSCEIDKNGRIKGEITKVSKEEAPSLFVQSTLSFQLDTVGLMFRKIWNEIIAIDTIQRIRRRWWYHGN